MRRREIEAQLCSAPVPTVQGRPAAESGGSPPEWVGPSYDDYCVSNVAESLLSLLSASFDAPLPDEAFRGVETDVETVVFVLLDGFGYDEWTRVAEGPSLPRRFAERGALTPLTSIYPSETAAAFTSIHTGRPPIEHGLLGWFQYLDAIERDVVTLPFTTLEGTPITALDPSLDGTDLFDATPLSARVAETSLSYEAILPESIVDSAYSRAVFEGANRTGYESSAAFADRLRATVEAADGPTFVHGYEPSIDAAAHEAGLTSQRCRRTMRDVLAGLQSSLVDDLSPSVAAKTLLVVTADHGLVDTDPTENVDVTEWPSWPALRRTFRTDGAGAPREPTGSPRNMHVHVRPDRREAARSRLDAAVDGEVYARSWAVEAGLFGAGSPSTTFDRRCGDLVAIHRNRGLCWRAADLEHIGMHGGLTRAEMLVPFAVGRVDALRT